MVKNNQSVFKDEVMYLSGAPLHVLSMNAMYRFRREMGEHGREHANQFDWTILANRLLAFYQETLDRVHGRGAAAETA